MPPVRCTDIGMKCKLETTAETEDELMTKMEEHAREAHRMKAIPPDVTQKVKRAIRK